MKKEKDILKNISSKNTSTNFSNKVMSDIYEIEREKDLAKLLRKNSKLSTKANFSYSVMQNIESLNKTKVPLQIFTKLQKIFILSFIIIIISIAIFTSNSYKISNNFDFIDFSNIFDSNIFQIPAFVSILMFCIFLVLAFEFLLNTRKKSL